MRTTLLASTLSLLVLGACAPPAMRAVATFQPLGDSGVAGNAIFTEGRGTTLIRVEARNLEPGGHGVHVHAIGDCSASDGTSAGAHFNPDGGAHGQTEHTGHHTHHGGGHSGDLGNLDADTDGRGVLVVETDALTVAPGPRSVVGRSIIIHAHPDDMITQPGGASGARIGCGVITSDNPR